MLSVEEIARRYHHVEYAIGQAARACSAERNLPSELRDCIQRMDRQSDRVKQIIQMSDELQIRKLVDDLALLGERARRVCANGAVTLTPQMTTAVTNMHEELSLLKRQLH